MRTMLAVVLPILTLVFLLPVTAFGWSSVQSSWGMWPEYPSLSHPQWDPYSVQWQKTVNKWMQRVSGLEGMVSDEWDFLSVDSLCEEIQEKSVYKLQNYVHTKDILLQDYTVYVLEWNRVKPVFSRVGYVLPDEEMKKLEVSIFRFAQSVDNAYRYSELEAAGECEDREEVIEQMNKRLGFIKGSAVDVIRSSRIGLHY